MGPGYWKDSSRNSCSNKPSPVPLRPPALRVASPYIRFLAELFLGLSLTSTANQAYSDKALKSSP